MQQVIKVVGIIGMVASVLLLIADILFDINLKTHTPKIVAIIGFVLYEIGNRDWNLGKKRK